MTVVIVLFVLVEEVVKPDGVYVRRYVPELARIDGGAVHRPWRLPSGLRAKSRTVPASGTLF